MPATEIVKGRWYPQMPPAIDDETDDEYTNRLTGADRTNRRPYDHSRNRQCSIGYHDECSDRDNSGECSDRDNSGECECPCHVERRGAERWVEEWNRSHPIGTVVSFPSGAGEPDVATTSEAYIDGIWPVVELDTFPRPVRLSWLSVR